MELLLFYGIIEIEVTIGFMNICFCWEIISCRRLLEKSTIWVEKLKLGIKGKILCESKEIHGSKWEKSIDYRFCFDLVHKYTIWCMNGFSLNQIAVYPISIKPNRFPMLKTVFWTQIQCHKQYNRMPITTLSYGMRIHRNIHNLKLKHVIWKVAICHAFS